MTVLHDFYSHRNADPHIQKRSIIETAAKLIRDDIKAVETPHRIYPACAELGSDECINFLPESLRVLLEGLIVRKHVQTEIASIGQAIMQAARQRVLLAPLQVGLGVQLHHHFASRFLIDSLHCNISRYRHTQLHIPLQTMWTTTSEHWMAMIPSMVWG